MTVHSSLPLGAQWPLRHWFKLQGLLFKRTLIKRTASAGPRRVTGLSSEGLEGGDQHGNPSVSPRGQLCRENSGLEHVCAHMLMFTACVPKDVCLCPPMIHLVFAGSG